MVKEGDKVLINGKEYAGVSKLTIPSTGESNEDAVFLETTEFDFTYFCRFIFLCIVAKNCRNYLFIISDNSYICNVFRTIGNNNPAD